ncbi:hypothetical protein [Arthrobacter sp. zg-Y1116]|uniref:hypothetical protein n=1 Tax=Arthrobacter sp. zg-Y1116 TaxID=2964611 RepID=UPI0021026718|nr:hypothetical protein [Arthrobacter sp. zg-Y1116]MCQ1945801.1 hypothetical protein [Arthrobacter sp. zg-Y1116]
MAFRPPDKPQADVAAGARGDPEASRPEGSMEGRTEGRTEGKAEPANPGAANTEPNDRGAGTVAALAICMVLLGFSVVALVMVQASVAAVRAAAAADLAALAGADALRGLGPSGAAPSADYAAGIQGFSGLDAGAGADSGNQGSSRLDVDVDADADTGAGAASRTGNACRVAGEVAARNNAALRDCTADPRSGSVTVEMEVQVPALPVPATARARAGPPG